jgi:hypothetical protein
MHSKLPWPTYCERSSTLLCSAVVAAIARGDADDLRRGPKSRAWVRFHLNEYGEFRKVAVVVVERRLGRWLERERGCYLFRDTLLGLLVTNGLTFAKLTM